MRDQILVTVGSMLLVAVWVVGGEVPASAHPDVDLNTPCDVCHAEITPLVVEQWNAGPHGEFNVKCFVCHDSIGASEPGSKQHEFKVCAVKMEKV